MKSVRLTGSAYRDLSRLAEFLAPKNPRAASAAVDTLMDAVQSRSEFPERGRLIGGGVRELLVPFGRDGYVIRYRFFEDEVAISRIFHARERR